MTTYGNTSPAGWTTSAITVNQIWTLPVTLSGTPAGAKFTKVRLRIKGGGSATEARIVLYDNDGAGGLAGTLLDWQTIFVETFAGNDIYEVWLPKGVDASDGTYYVGFQSKGTAPEFGLASAGGAGLGTFGTNTYGSAPPSSFPSPTTLVNWNIAVEVDVEVPTAPVPTRTPEWLVSGGNHTALTIPKPTGTVEGELMIAVISGWSNLIASSTPSGWTQLGSTQAQGASSDSFQVWYKVAGASEPSSYTWTPDGSGNQWWHGVIHTFQASLTPTVIAQGTDFLASATKTKDLGTVATDKMIYFACGLTAAFDHRPCDNIAANSKLTAEYDTNTDDTIAVYLAQGLGTPNQTMGFLIGSSNTNCGYIAVGIQASPAGPSASWTQVTIPAKYLPNGVERNPAIYTAQRLSPLGVAVNRSASTTDELTALTDAYDASL